jgi:hypothetical protein
MILRPEADTVESRQNWRNALSDGSFPINRITTRLTLG